MRLSTDEKVAGVLAPVFAIRVDDEAELGIGDTSSLKKLIDWAAGVGLRLVKLLPVNETGEDHSPYNALSSKALEPVTLRMAPKEVPGLSAEHLTEALREHARGKADPSMVDYQVVKALKGKLLQQAFVSFCTDTAWETQRRKLNAFIHQQETWLREYAIFRALTEYHGTAAWPSWPAEHQSLNAFYTWYDGLALNEQSLMDERVLFFSYVQWVAFRQWKAVKRHAARRKVALMGDVPFGVASHSADVWAQRHLFLKEWYGGAPPEEFFKHDPFVQKWGQNWGIPVYDWEAHRSEEFRWWKQRVAGVRQFFDLFRIDHILGFFRIYAFPWSPERNREFLPLATEEAKILTGGSLPTFHPRSDDTEANRLLNRKEGTDILKAIVADAGSHSVVGEDLGLIPDYVPHCLRELGIAGYKIPQWQTRPDGSLQRGEEYERLSLATYGTHDHEPLRALWERLVADAASGLHAAGALQALANFADIAPAQEMGYSHLVHEALFQALLRSNSWMVVFTINDIFGRTERFNLPGVAGAQNWTQRMHAPLHALTKSWEVQMLARSIKQWRGGSEVSLGQAAGRRQERSVPISKGLKLERQSLPRTTARGATVKARRKKVI